MVRGITFPHSSRREQLAHTLEHASELLSVNKAIDVRSRLQIQWQPSGPLNLDRWNAIASSTRLFRGFMYQQAAGYIRRNFGSETNTVRSFMGEMRRAGPWTRRSEARQGSRYTWKGMYLLDKHLRAWVDLLESDCDFVFIFEDDAQIRADEHETFSEFLPQILANEPMTTNYVDLCGHFNFREHFPQFDRAVVQRRDDWFRVPLISNTSCAYIMSRPLAAAFLDLVMENPKLRRLNSDWAVNVLAANLQGVMNPTCWMRIPGPVLNQSLTFGGSQIAEPE